MIKPQYQLAFDFSDGLAPVKIKNKWGYINKAGEIAIKPQFKSAYEFQNGLAMVETARGKGYIDRTGKYIWQPSR